MQSTFLELLMKKLYGFQREVVLSSYLFVFVLLVEVKLLIFIISGVEFDFLNFSLLIVFVFGFDILIFVF